MLVDGKNISLRIMTTDDTENIVKWRNNPRVRKNFVYREIFTAAIHENWIKTKVQTGYVFQMIVCEKNNNNRPIGSVYFRDIDHEKLTAEYGIFIGEDDAIGKGYGNEIAVLATDYAKDVMKLKSVILRTFLSNEAAIKSYEHAGFVKVKDLPAVECSDGFIADMILMEKKLS